MLSRAIELDELNPQSG